MTSLLAIDTSSDICSVAISHENRTLQLNSSEARKHAAEVLPMVQSLLDESGVKLATLDAIVMVSGPGSFTGLRIGTAVAQGLSFGAGIPIIRVSALAMQARAAFLAGKQSPGAECVFFIALHARADEFYFACYRDDGLSQPAALIEDQLCDAATILTYLETGRADCDARYCAGSGWLHPWLQRTDKGNEGLARLTGIVSDAGILCTLANYAFAAGQIESADEALPVYLKEDMAYRKS